MHRRCQRAPSATCNTNAGLPTGDGALPLPADHGVASRQPVVVAKVPRRRRLPCGTSLAFSLQLRQTSGNRREPNQRTTQVKNTEHMQRVNSAPSPAEELTAVCGGNAALLLMAADYGKDAVEKDEEEGKKFELTPPLPNPASYVRR